MVIKIKIPNIGEDELEVTEILVNIGDLIDINQPLLIIEGDKSSMEIPSPYSGIIQKIYINIGDKIHTGSTIFLLDTNNKSTNTDTSLNNDKYNLQYDTKINNPDLIIDNNKKKFNKMCNKIYSKKCEFNHNNSNYFIYASPVIRHMARKLGIDLSKVKGSGRKGRIIKEDIKNYFSIISMKYKNCIKKPIITSNQSNTIIVSNTAINPNKFGDTNIIPLHKVQKISGFNLQKNWSQIPHVTQFDMVDITNLETFRKQQNLEISKKNINCKITILIFIIKAVANALEKLPRFNSSLSKDGQHLIIKKYINIGIAVDTTRGLIVPVLRNINKKGIITLSQELSVLIQKARSGKNLSPLDIQGGNFTISNLGSIGGTSFTPIINAPEVAILGISKSEIQPVWTGKRFEPKLMLPLSLSYDHRVIDGADGARFINLINKTITDIRLLSM